MKQPKIDWTKEIKPLIKKYKDSKHPLEAKNLYQMLVMVVLSAQTTDTLINNLASDLFKAYPTLASLSKASQEEIVPHITKVRNFNNKAGWLTKVAAAVKKDKDIPLTMDTLIKLPGIGRKSANVIKRFAGADIEGIVVDVHVVRVAPRLGIAVGEDPAKIEQQMMEILPKTEWDAGMAMSFLGREICKPKPECNICLMNKVCAFYNGWN